MLENPVTDITIAMELNYFQLNRAEYFVPVHVKIPGSELALARRRGAQRTLLDFIGEVKDNYGITIQNVRDKLDIPISRPATPPSWPRGRSSTRPASRCCRASTSSSSWRATRRPAAWARIRRRSRFRISIAKRCGCRSVPWC